MSQSSSDTRTPHPEHGRTQKHWTGMRRAWRTVVVDFNCIPGTLVWFGFGQLFVDFYIFYFNFMFSFGQSKSNFEKFQNNVKDKKFFFFVSDLTEENKFYPQTKSSFRGPKLSYQWTVVEQTVKTSIIKRSGTACSSCSTRAKILNLSQLRTRVRVVRTRWSVHGSVDHWSVNEPVEIQKGQLALKYLIYDINGPTEIQRPHEYQSNLIEQIC